MSTSKRRKPQSKPAGAPTADLHVAGFVPLASPDEVKSKLPADEAALATVLRGRDDIRQAMSGQDPRLVIIIGPCSVHDPAAALEYAQRLAKLRAQHADKLVLVMRVYFEKPRTTIGWKGLINDPHGDGSCDINTGLRDARKLLLQINGLGVPCATEFLDPIVPQYTADLVTWAAIGARTTESQTHREMTSGLSMPVGFKNPTDGNLQIALNAMISARSAHVFLGIDGAGRSCIVRTNGNPDVHLVLRGGKNGANYHAADVAAAKAAMAAGPEERRIMIDCGHGQTGKDVAKTPVVFRDVLAQRQAGEKAILGMMVESNLVAGRQGLGGDLVYGQSITDPCIDWETTDELLREAAE